MLLTSINPNGQKRNDEFWPQKESNRYPLPNWTLSTSWENCSQKHHHHLFYQNTSVNTFYAAAILLYSFPLNHRLQKWWYFSGFFLGDRSLNLAFWNRNGQGEVWDKNAAQLCWPLTTRTLQWEFFSSPK